MCGTIIVVPRMLLGFAQAAIQNRSRVISRSNRSGAGPNRGFQIAAWGERGENHAAWVGEMYLASDLVMNRLEIGVVKQRVL
jgi:hypothetical protein